MPEVFSIVPASTKPLWVLAAIGTMLVVFLLPLGFFAYSSRATRFEVSPAGLAVQGTLYGRTLPWSSLLPEQARIVNLDQSFDLQPTLRTNGVGLPGYQAGWFRLRQGGTGLLFVTDRSQVVALPTREGFTLLLSVSQPQAFVDALQRAAGHK